MRGNSGLPPVVCHQGLGNAPLCSAAERQGGFAVLPGRKATMMSRFARRWDAAVRIGVRRISGLLDRQRRPQMDPSRSSTNGCSASGRAGAARRAEQV